VKGIGGLSPTGEVLVTAASALGAGLAGTGVPVSR
jgi:hypothetical protein